MDQKRTRRQPDDQYVVEDDTITIINTQWTDAGVYECSINITDIAKQDIVRSDLYDLVAPVNIILTKNVKLEEGETARIGCNATGYPSPTLTWYKGDKQMVNGSIDGRVFVTIVEDQGDATVVISTINIRRIVSDDAGVYTCNATNNHTTAGEAYQLEVRDPLAALWPFLGIMAEVILLITLILGVECYQKKKAAARNN
ncbi:basigin-like [Ptychodera flava]|uniref:basigin-like n=1 Tax=Ptychodera flava TaxID=63121 RepID=UPI00396A924E